MKKIIFQGEELMVHDDTNPANFKEVSETEILNLKMWGKTEATEEIKPVYHAFAQDAMYREQARIAAEKIEKQAVVHTRSVEIYVLIDEWLEELIKVEKISEPFENAVTRGDIGTLNTRIHEHLKQVNPHIEWR